MILGLLGCFAATASPLLDPNPDPDPDLTPDSDAGPLAEAVGLEQPVARRRVEMDRWRFEPIFAGEPRALVAVLAFRPRIIDPDLGDRGGHDFTAKLYLLDEAARELPIERFAAIESWPPLPSSVGWIERSAWADNLIPLVFAGGFLEVRDYTELLTGMYAVPGYEDLAPAIAAFPDRGDPLLNAADGDRAVARRALDQIVDFFGLPTGRPSVADLRRERFDALDQVFVEILPISAWTPAGRGEPVDGACACTYDRRTVRLLYEAELDLKRSFIVDTGFMRAWRDGHSEPPLVRPSTSTESWTHEVAADEPCPDASEVPELISLWQHEQSVSRRANDGGAPPESP